MPSRPWHKRWHGNALNGTRSLSLELRGAYQTLQDLMYDSGGPIRLEERRICGEFDCDVRVLKRVMTALIAADKIRLWSDGSTVWIVNDRVLKELKVGGYEPATSAELSPNLRDKFAIAIEQLPAKSERKFNENSGGQEKSEAKKGPLEEEEEEEPPNPLRGDDQFSLLPAEPEPVDDVTQAFRLWNDMAGRYGLPLAADLTDARRRSIGKRLERGGLKAWRVAVDAVEASAFCRGQVPARDGSKPFKAHIDFVCQPSSFQKLIEGFYGRDAKAVEAPRPAADPDDVWRRRVKAWQSGSRYWNTNDWEAAPGKPGCIVPVRILAEFNIVAPLAEATEERAA